MARDATRVESKANEECMPVATCCVSAKPV
jgi:hypothetical protein